MTKFKINCFDDNGDIKSGCANSPANSYFYGLGLGYNLNKQLALNLEYNIMKPSLKFKDSSDKIKSEIDMIKLGISYRF